MNVRLGIAGVLSLILWSCSSSEPAPMSSAKVEKSMMAKEPSGGFYAEETHTGRLYVFGTEKAHSAFKESQQVPAIAKTYIGAGPDGQTVVLEADAKTADLQNRLRSQYEIKHSAKLQ